MTNNAQILVRLPEEKLNEILQTRMAYIVANKEEVSRNDWYVFLLEKGIDTQLEEFVPDE